MIAGVTLIAPDRVYLEARVEIEADTILEPDVSLKGDTRVGANSIIGQGCILIDTIVETGVSLKPYCHLEKAHVGKDSTVGPFARLREGTVLRDRVKIGNFVETKKAEFDVGAKASHLSYIGDASVGANANIGAGTITCNYDGTRKSKTKGL